MKHAVTANTVAANALAPAMEATALQMQMRRLVDRPETAQVDSLREVLAVMHGSLRLMDDLVTSIAHANGMQLPELQHVAGWADQLVTELHDAESNGTDERPPSGRKLAAELRPLLDTIAGDDPIDAAVALTDVFRMFTGASRELLFRDAVTYQLGAARSRQLTDLYDRFQQRRAETRAGRRTREAIPA